MSKENFGNQELLTIRGLSISFQRYEKGTRQNLLPVIRDLQATVREKEIVAIVGASGSGKSLLAHAVMGLLPSNARMDGQILYQGEPLNAKRLEQLRGRQIALVPQSVTYLDPLMKIGKQVTGVRRNAKNIQRQRELFAKYDLPADAENLYPFACSGGMIRRILLAAALMESPRLIIADEPTPGLDMKLAKRAMEDFREFARQGNGVLLITHDLELAIQTADRIVVFYAGCMVEEAKASDFASEASLRHPYTRALWKAMPRNGFVPIEGRQPYARELTEGCVFRARCPWAGEGCDGPIPVCEKEQGLVRCVRYAPDGRTEPRQFGQV